MDLITLFEYIGLFVFAASGAICAMEKKMDLFGILILATVTAINTQFTLKSNLPFLLDQIEALASGETLPGVDVTCDRKGWGKCYRTEGFSPLNFCCEWDGSPVIACAWDPCD